MRAAGLVDQDLAVADVARKAQDSTLVVASKWDIAKVGIEDLRPRLQGPPCGRRSLRCRPRPVAGWADCSTDRGALRQAHVPRHDGRLNRFLRSWRGAAAVQERQAAQPLYGTQTQVRPPRFRFFVNDPGLITRDYGYWVENQLRERFELEGVPVSIDFVRRP